MNKWFGKIGYAGETEIRPGIWNDGIVERGYYGDVISNNRGLQSSDKVNDDITISCKISIVADPYAQDHFHTMKYIEFMNAKWKISNVEVLFPRLILTLGGLYHGEQA